MATTVIPYNADAVTESQTIRDKAGNASYRLPTVAVEDGTALRLNGGQIPFGDPPPLADLPRVADRLGFLSRHFRQQCNVHAKYVRRFIAAYFDFVGREVDAHRDELREKLSRFGTLYEVEHWAFSALRPLPRAHLVAPAIPGEQPPHALVRCEIAYWTRSGPLSVELKGRTSVHGAERQRRARLESAGIRLLDVPHDVLDADDPAAFEALLPDDFRRFWRGEALPAGPFGNDAAVSASFPPETETA